METKKCPFCGEEILATAKKCKYCGKWLENKGITFSNTMSNLPAQKQVNKWIIIGGIIAILLTVIILLWLTIGKNTTTTSRTNSCLDFSEEWYYDDATENYQNERFEYALFFPKQLAVIGEFNDNNGAVIMGGESGGMDWWNAEIIVYAQFSEGRSLDDLYQDWKKEQKLEGFRKDRKNITSYYYNIYPNKTIIEKKKRFFIIEGEAYAVGATDYSLFYQKVIYDKEKDLFYFIRMLYDGYDREEGYIYKKMIEDCIPNFRNHIFLP